MSDNKHQNNFNLQQTLDKILNDPFLDSSLDFYSHRLKIEEIEEHNDSEKIDKPFSYVGNQGEFTSIEIQQKWQYDVMSKTLSTHHHILELPYRHNLELYFISYEINGMVHLLELSTSYSIFSELAFSETLIKELIEKVSMVIRYQVISIYNMNPFLLKNLFIFAHNQLWNYYLSLQDDDKRKDFNDIHHNNLELQKSLIKSYLEHPTISKGA